MVDHCYGTDRHGSITVLIPFAVPRVHTGLAPALAAKITEKVAKVFARWPQASVVYDETARLRLG